MAVFPNPHHGPIARVDDSTQEGLRVHQHAACGVGVLAHLDGHASHELIEDGFECLENLDHRGARGAEENTGDGAGMLLQKPHAFLSTLVPGLGDPDDYGVAQVFMPRDGDHRAAIRTLIARRCQAEGFDLIGWRQVPTQNEGLGQTALNSEPQTWQCFVRPKQALEPKAMDVRLYVLRRAIENEVLYRNLVGAGQQTFYICSLSRTTVVYKGLLTCGQFRCYFPDLSDTRVTSSLVLVHALRMLIPEAWEKHPGLAADRRDSYEYHSTVPSYLPKTIQKYLNRFSADFLLHRGRFHSDLAT
ncbi:hypothetical protein [Ectothiorhodospira marina]|uniref:Glutamate synthase (NADPH/NADH) large chain n=1 Tax=Ectothiorhodospira marina TaxID=1396821 RepID=A0A1H7MPI7_9GAMM|nr:hypothetical protein [Ectothiorhodospira marina]SEL12989.1 glutamate synthase (NADPH/NADH) large chain [Ectothiorhodospira marina]